jgi:hypothetical protein
MGSLEPPGPRGLGLPLSYPPAQVDLPRESMSIDLETGLIITFLLGWMVVVAVAGYLVHRDGLWYLWWSLICLGLIASSIRLLTRHNTRITLERMEAQEQAGEFGRGFIYRVIVLEHEAAFGPDRQPLPVGVTFLTDQERGGRAERLSLPMSHVLWQEAGADGQTTIQLTRASYDDNGQRQWGNQAIITMPNCPYIE